MDSAYGALARQSTRLADLTDQYPQLAKAFDKMAQGVMVFARVRSIQPAAVTVGVAVNEGRIVVSVYA